MFRVSTTPIMSAQNCNYSLRYCAATSLQRGPNEMQQKAVLQVHSKCFECQPHPSSGVHKTVTTASGTVHLPPSSVALTKYNTKQSIYYSASSLYMFRVSNTPIVRSTQNCNYSLRYCAATFPPTWPSGHVGGR